MLTRVVSAHPSSGALHEEGAIALVRKPSASRASATAAIARSPSAADLVVSATGMVSPVGADSVQTFTSVRAGIRRMRELPEIYLCLPADPGLGEPSPLVGSAIYHLDAQARREGRLAEWLGLLAAQAFRDLARQARIAPADRARLGLFLALPAGMGLEDASRQEEVVRHFHDFAELDRLSTVQIAFGDRTAALGLAEQAAELLRQRRVDLAAVGGVDSYLFHDRLAALDRDWCILSERNPDGFQPGEAAGFLLLEPRGEAERRGLAPLVEVRGLARERFDAASRLPNTGVELASLLEPFLAPDATAPLFVCDLNGDSARAREWAFAVSRLGKRLAAGFALEHPASALGDVGAATGAVLAALAIQYLKQKHTRRDRAVVWAGSDGGERRAILLGRT